jgi:hypothetical protein
MTNDQAAEKLARQLFHRAMQHHIDENLSGPWQRERGSYAFDVRICDFQTVDFDAPTDHVARVVITVGGG